MPAQAGGGTEGVCKRTREKVGTNEKDFNAFTGFCSCSLDAIHGQTYI